MSDEAVAASEAGRQGGMSIEPSTNYNKQPITITMLAWVHDGTSAVIEALYAAKSR